MTLNAFIKALEKIRDKGHGRCKVAVDKDSLWDGNGCFNICDVNAAEYCVINVADDDGGIACDSKGVERMTRAIVIRGREA